MNGKSYKPYKKNLSTVKTKKPGKLHWSNLPEAFDCQRILILSDFSDLTETNKERGNHANPDCNELLFIVQGKANISLESGEEKHLFTCCKNDYVMIPKNYYLNIEIIHKNTVCFVLCDSKR
jgi:homogentisate 1,2-dioxygenase